jgi:hypothetical protein
MVIRKSDRVSSVLKADESLIDVFVGLSPAFERLRNPGMRKVMTRLVTVEQAARMAGVDADELVARLNAGSNAATGAEHGTPGDAARSAAQPDAFPSALAAIAEDDVIDVDVRDDLRNGREPFSRIMAARSRIPAGGALRLRAIFEPVPLYAVMRKFGFTHHTVPLGPDDWEVWFYAEPPDAGAKAPPTPRREARADRAADDAWSADHDVVVLDVRGLEPPEPMVRTLAALEELPPDATLVQLNARVPQFLLPQLEQRGFVYEVREQAPDLVRVFIRRAPPREESAPRNP